MMIRLTNKFTLEEQQVIKMYQDDKLEVLAEIEDGICFLLNSKGDLTYEMCFGIVVDSFFMSQHFIRAMPQKVIKYYQFYLLENQGEDGEWYVGEKRSNNKIEFYKSCSSLRYAFESL